MLDINNANANTTKVISLFTWLAYDIFLGGLFIYTWMVLQVETFATTLDTIEKFVLFLCTVSFGAYRIVILHLDAEKKRMENKKMKQEMLKDKRA